MNTKMQNYLLSTKIFFAESIRKENYLYAPDNKLIGSTTWKYKYFCSLIMLYNKFRRLNGVVDVLGELLRTWRSRY